MHAFEADLDPAHATEALVMERYGLGPLPVDECRADRAVDRLAPKRGFWWIEREENGDEERQRGDQEAETEGAARG